jgi:hypothetical protein
MLEWKHRLVALMVVAVAVASALGMSQLLNHGW